MRTNIDNDDELMTKAGNCAITDRTLNRGHRGFPAPAGMNRRPAAFMIVPPELRPREVLGVVSPVTRGIDDEPREYCFPSDQAIRLRIANGNIRPEAAVRPLAGAQCAWNCRRCGSGIRIRLVSSMARAKIARNLS
jgi:hypothetical protein